MKKLLIAALIALPLIAQAKQELFDPVKEGLPLPDGGIQIKPAAKMKMPTAGISYITQVQNEIKTKGFYSVDEPEARIMLKMPHDKVLKAGSNNPEDTNWKSRIEDVVLAFEFKGIPIDTKNVIGYAASGLFKDGWSGVTEGFTDPTLGVCQYTLSNLKISHGSTIIPEEVARHDVNGKVSTLDVRGSDNSGYIYTVGWFDSNAMQDIRCANMTFNKAITQKLIELAKKTDKSVIIK